jgi:Domain of unknown function (DUF4349)
MRRNRHWLVAVGTVALLALAGCSGDDAGGGDSAGTSADEAAPAPEQAGGDDAAADADAREGGPDESGTGGEALVDPRSIIYTGTITVRVGNVDAAAAGATALAQRHRGFVGGDERTATAGEPAQATMQLRIPSEQFTATVNELGELGEEEARAIHTEDVTEEVVDLETRIATAEASVDRTRDLLARAESIQDIVAVERELSEREATLGSLQARQRTLADLTALSTITVVLIADEPEVEEDDESGFLGGLAAGWRGLTQSVSVLLTVLGVLLPWLVVFGAPAAAVVWWRRRRPRPAPVESPATPE